MSLICVDTRLYTAAAQSGEDAEYWLDLATVQAGNADYRDHILAYNDEFVWRRLKARRQPISRNTLKIRCIRCGAIASLREWFVACSMGTRHAEELYNRLLATSDPERLQWLRHCRAARVGQETMALLASMAISYREDLVHGAQA